MKQIANEKRYSGKSMPARDAQMRFTRTRTLSGSPQGRIGGIGAMKKPDASEKDASGHEVKTVSAGSSADPAKAQRCPLITLRPA